MAIDSATITLLAVFYVGLKIWNRAGGWPEAYYRARGIHYFQDYIITVTGKVERPIFKFKDVKVHSPAMIRWNGGDYNIGDPKGKFANPHNAPAWLHRWDDSRALQVNEDLGDDRCDAQLIASGYDDDVYERLNRLGLPLGMFKGSRAALLLLIAVAGLVCIDIYYNWNTTCAVRSLICR